MELKSGNTRKPLASRLPLRLGRLSLGGGGMSESRTQCLRLGFASSPRLFTALLAAMVLAAVLSVMPAVQAQGDPIQVSLKFDTKDRSLPERLVTVTVTAEAERSMSEDVSFPLEFAFGDAASAMFTNPDPWLAAATQDDVDIPSSIVIPRNKLRSSVSLKFVDDEIDETLESFFMRFDEGNFPVGYAPMGDLGTKWQQFKIFDRDETKVTLTGTGVPSIDEGATVDYTLSLSRSLRAFNERYGFEPQKGYESLTVPLFFGFDSTATPATDFRLSCSTETGVTCRNMNSANPTVTFNADPTPGDQTDNDDVSNALTTAKSVTITLTASTDSVSESGGELVIIGMDNIDASNLSDHLVERAPDPAVLRICDPGTSCAGTTGTEGTDPNPDTNPNPNPQPSNPQPSSPRPSSGSSTRVTTTTTVPSAPVFTDLDETFAVHREAVDALVKDGVFNRIGCATNRLCPDQTINRWRPAVIMIRQLDGANKQPPAITRSVFSDVNASSWWSRYVQRLSRLEITRGCATDPLRYCPDDPLTRAQAASFIARAYKLTSSTDPGFVDIEGSVHEADINAMYAAGITKGCATEPLRFCPDKPLTLQEFATMLHRAKQRPGT